MEVRRNDSTSIQSNGSLRNDENIQDVLKKLTDRIENLEVLFTDQQQNSNTKHIPMKSDVNFVTKRCTLRHVLAEHVGVIGLKETLTESHKAVKMIWVLLLLFGSAATIYYIYDNVKKYQEDNISTKASYKRLDSYEFPPFYICPPWPLDHTNHVLVKDISLDALQYSLGYLYWNPVDESNPPFVEFAKFNVSKSNMEFLKFYNEKKFKSLFHYYETITANVSDCSWTNDEQCNNSTLRLAACNHCNYRPPTVPKVVFNNIICYAFHFDPVMANSPGEPPQFLLINRNIIPPETMMNKLPETWVYDLLPNVGVFGPSSLLTPGNYDLKISVQEVQMLENTGRCNPTAVSMNQTDPYVECQQNCHMRFELALYNNTSLYLNDTTQPINALNYYDGADVWPTDDTIIASLVPASTTNSSEADESQRKENEAKRKNDEYCRLTCKPQCRSYVYDITFQYKQEKRPFSENSSSSSSWIHLTLHHAALRQGGIMVWEELNTMTFSEFVANLGGMLGLFLGCTLLTVAQLILSFVNYMLGSRGRPEKGKGNV